MWRINQRKSLVQRLLPALALFAALISGSLTVNGQQNAFDATTAPTASPALADPAFHAPPEGIGDSLFVRQRYQEAIEAYKKAPNDSPDVMNKMGIAYQMMFDLKDAARCYKQSLRLRPGNAWVLNNLGTIYDFQGDFRKAEDLYRKALKLDPQSARITMNLGTNLMIQNKYDEGWDMYKRALALDHDVFDAEGTPTSTNMVPLEQRGAMNYFKAKGCAQAGLNDSAIKYLHMALSEGFTSPAKIAEDSSFDRLRGNPSFERLLSEQEKPSTP